MLKIFIIVFKLFQGWNWENWNRRQLSEWLFIALMLGRCSFINIQFWFSTEEHLHQKQCSHQYSIDNEDKSMNLVWFYSFFIWSHISDVLSVFRFLLFFFVSFTKKYLVTSNFSANSFLDFFILTFNHDEIIIKTWACIMGTVTCDFDWTTVIV